MSTRDLPPVHPGEQLREEFMKPLGISAYRLAKDLDVPVSRVQDLAAERRAITGDTALRFGHWFGTEPQFWLNLQAQFDLTVADRQTGEAIRHLPTRAGVKSQPEQSRAC